VPCLRRHAFLIASAWLLLSAWLIFFVVTPPFQSPDEDGHYTFVQSLANGIYPVLSKGEPTHESVSPMAKELREAYLMEENSFNAERIFNTERRAIDETKSDAAETSVQATYPPFYYFASSLFYRAAKIAGFSPLTLFFVTKLSSLMFYMIFVGVFSWYFRRILPSREADYLTLAVGLQPMVLLAATAVNPEIAAVALFSVAFVALLVSLKKGYAQLEFALILAVLSSLAILTKVTNVILAPVILAGFALFINLRPAKKVLWLSTYAFATLATLVPWLYFNVHTYDSLLPHNLVLFAKTGPSNTMYVVMTTLIDVKESIFYLPGIFGWLDAPLFRELRYFYVFILIVFVAVGSWHALRRAEDGDSSSGHEQVAFFSVALLVIFLISYSVNMNVKYHWISGLQGRYFLVGTVPATVLFYSGLRRTIKVKSTETLARSLFLLSLICFLVSVLFIIIPRFYV
jgi:4-amino-4-deoxy-L-arabinose transferase-like glycosyltransferase